MGGEVRVILGGRVMMAIGDVRVQSGMMGVVRVYVVMTAATTYSAVMRG